MEQKKNFKSEVKELIPAIGFIKTRKLESIAMDMAEKLQEEAEKKGYIVLETFVDRDRSRDIDREQLNEIYAKYLRFHRIISILEKKIFLCYWKDVLKRNLSKSGR